MKRFTALAVLIAAAGCASAATDATTATQKTTKKKAAAPAAVNPVQVTIPKDAVSNGDGSYSWADKAGKKWTFVDTPFGVSKTPAVEASASTPAPPASKQDLTKAIDQGETVRFERPTPFGTTAWEKKKTDLTDYERSVLESQPSKAGAR